MVWGMPLPENFGEFWPSGCFEKDAKTGDSGWYDRLTAYYKEQSPEEQKRLFDYKSHVGNAAHSYGTFPSSKFKKEPGTQDSGGVKPRYGSIESHEVPRSFDTAKSHKKLGSLIMLAGKIFAVDEPLKAIIERLEPGVHEFFPFEIRMPKGKVYPSSYYILRVGRYFDAFSREDSWSGSVEESDHVPGLLHLNRSKKGITGLAFHKPAYDAAHLWRDRTFGEDLTCFSDALVAEIEQAGLRLPKHYKLKEV